MRPRHHLEATLREESRAYGYTLTIWGTGALLIGDLGVPTTVEVFAFAAGAVAGFAALSLAAFGGPFERAETDRPSAVVVSMIHVAATLGALGCGELLLSRSFPDAPLAAVVAAAVTVAYNLLLLVEQWVAEAVA